ncbi:MAG: trimethyllysine dioxygenase [Actinomycetota bacterium]|nr:trimethyllysine dioxygenase [Actinomycetota bacterium]
MASISAVTAEHDRLEVTWDDGATSSYPFEWVRDHDHDEATLHPVTRQRQIHALDVDPGLAAASAEVTGDTVTVVWRDGAGQSALPVSFLERFREPAAPAPRITVAPELWDAASLVPTPSTPYEAIMTTEEGRTAYLTQVATYGFALATDTPSTAEATEELVRRIAYVRESIFGGFWEFTADLSKADTAYTNLELLAHTDGTYSHDAPGLQLLHCLYFDGTGGESTMTDGFRVAQELKDKHPEHYDTLSRVMIPGQYIGDGSHLLSSRPVLRHDHTGQLVQVSYNNADRAPFLLPHDEMTAFYAAIRTFEEIANDARLQWRHVLAPGEAMLFDNWRALHGRAAYTGKRKLCGSYLNHEDFESRLRLAASA